MINRRAKQAGLRYSTGCHTFQATGITQGAAARWNMSGR
jgi:hypothetical protein